MARRFAYLTPDTDGTQTIVSRCLSVPLPLLPHVVGALSELTNVWQWEQFGTMAPEDAAQLAAVMLNDFSEDCAMNCEELLLCLAQSPLNSTIPDDALLRVENGQPQYSYDGTNWLDVYGDSAADPIGRPLTATTGADADARICLAATRAMLVLAETYKGVYGAVTADIYNTSNRFANWLNNFNRWLSGIVWPDAAWITQSELLRTNALPENYTAGELSAESKQDLLCLLVDYATDTDGVVTFDWDAIRDNTVAALGINPGTAVWSIIVYLKNRGIEIASVTPITDVAGNCSCGTCDSYFDDFNSGLGPKSYIPSALMPYGARVPATGGAWDATVGYGGTGGIRGSLGVLPPPDPAANYMVSQVVVDMGLNCSIESVDMRWRTANNGYTERIITLFNASGVQVARNVWIGPSGAWTHQNMVYSPPVSARYVSFYAGGQYGLQEAYIDDVTVIVA